MPSARELLEQADALMRRNRLASGAHDATASTPIAHDAIASAPAADDGIPVLTEEIVVPPPAALAVVAPAPAAGEVIQDLEDVPLLTDAVEEIEAPSILESPEDEPSEDNMWEETLTGSGPTQAGVPVEPAAQVPPFKSIEAGAPPAVTLTTAVESIDISAPPEEPPERRWYDPHEVLRTPSREAEPQAMEEAPLAMDAQALPSAEHADEVPPATHADELPPAAPADELSSATDADAGSLRAPPQDVEPLESTPAADQADHAPAAAPAASPPDDEARWTALAEEVRMQVLQRIDLFTDTGLREQLAARLQPIVDRASADLVATINQHVGVLLRAYVAEAIEREIERWRSGGR